MTSNGTDSHSNDNLLCSDCKASSEKDTKLFHYYSQYAFFSFSKISSSKLMLLILHCFYNFAAYKRI